MYALILVAQSRPHAKLNAHFDFVQGGQIYEVRPEALRKNIRIDVFTPYPLPEKAQQFLSIKRAQPHGIGSANVVDWLGSHKAYLSCAAKAARTTGSATMASIGSLHFISDFSLV
jgi:hypothetical protein